MKILNVNNKADILSSVLWQYDGAAKLKSLIKAKQAFTDTNLTAFWQNWYRNVFNIDTADSFGLAVWGRILQFPRQFTGPDGSLQTFDDNQYRLLLKGQILKFRSGGTVPDINLYLKTIFEDFGPAYVLDNLDMSITLFLNFEPPEWLDWLLANIDFIPSPAGVQVKYNVIPEDVFGFAGSGLETFNNGVFYSDYNENIEDKKDKYQFYLDAPETADVSLNGVKINYTPEVKEFWYYDEEQDISYYKITAAAGYYAYLDKNSNYSLNVGRAGFETFTQTGAASSDIRLKLYEYYVTVGEGVNLQINGQDVDTYNQMWGCYSLEDTFSFTWAISKDGDIKTSYLPHVLGYPSGYLNHIDLGAPAGIFSMNKIRSDKPGAEELYSFILSKTGTLQIDMTAESGLYNGAFNSSACAKSGSTLFKLQAMQGDVFSFKKLNGGVKDEETHGGAGLALYVNNKYIASAGGGGAIDTASGLGYGGGGYNGGAVIGGGISGAGIVAEKNTAVSQRAGGGNIITNSVSAYGGTGFADEEHKNILSPIIYKTAINGGFGSIYVQEADQ